MNQIKVVVSGGNLHLYILREGVFQEQTLGLFGNATFHSTYLHPTIRITEALLEVGLAKEEAFQVIRAMLETKDVTLHFIINCLRN